MGSFGRWQHEGRKRLFQIGICGASISYAWLVFLLVFLSARILEKYGFTRTASFLNAGIYGSKFLDAWCWRYRLNLDAKAATTPDSNLRQPAALSITRLDA